MKKNKNTNSKDNKKKNRNGKDNKKRKIKTNVRSSRKVQVKDDLKQILEFNLEHQKN